MTLPLSVLDLAQATGDDRGSDAVRRLADTARLAERLGFVRFWIAEHHNMRSLACSAPEVLIAHVAAATERIRVGSGGVMLGNHVPLQVAERYQTLAALHPDRIDLGLGRAPGTDPLTRQAMRSFDPESFPQQLEELRGLASGTLPEGHPFKPVRVVPNDPPLPPLWILGSSGSSARFAGESGTGYAFASHFSPTPAAPAMLAYRNAFRPSPERAEPHAILALSVVCADTDQEAEWLAGSQDLMAVYRAQGQRRRLPSPQEAEAYAWTPELRAVAARARALHVVGGPETVRAEVERRAEASGADEVMVFTSMWDPDRRLRNYELVAAAFADAHPDRPMASR